MFRIFWLFIASVAFAFPVENLRKICKGENSSSFNVLTLRNYLIRNQNGIKEHSKSINEVLLSVDFNHDCAEILTFMILKGLELDRHLLSKLGRDYSFLKKVHSLSDVPSFIQRKNYEPDYSVKSVGGTLADAVLGDLVHEGTAVEGQSTVISSLFLIDVFKSLQKKLDLFTEAKEKCCSMIDEFLFSIAQSHLFGAIMTPHDGTMSFKRPSDGSVNFDLLKTNLMLFAVECLKNDQKILFPFGYLGIGSSHAMLLEIVKIDDKFVNMLVYNTGSGVENHNFSFSNIKTKASTLLQFSKVPIALLKEIGFFQSAYEVLTFKYSKIELYNEGYVYFSVLRIFSALESFKTRQSRQVYTGVQKSGTCHIRVYHAYFFHKLKAHLYREFKIIVHQFIIDQVIEKKQAAINETMKLILTEGIRQTSNSLLKLLKTNAEKFLLIKSAKTLMFDLWRQRQILQKLETGVVVDQKLNLNQKFDEIDMKSAIDEIKKITGGLSDQSSAPIDSFKYFSLPLNDTSQPVLHYLIEVKKQLENFTELQDTPKIVLQSKLDLFTAILINSPHPNFSEISSVDEALQSIYQLGEYFFYLIQSTTDFSDFELSQTLCYYKLIAWTFELANLEAHSNSLVSLASFRLDPEMLLKHRNLPGVLSFSNEIEQKFDHLYEFLESQKDSKKESLPLIMNDGEFIQSFDGQENTIIQRLVSQIFEFLPKNEQEALKKQGDDEFSSACPAKGIRTDVNYELMTLLLHDKQHLQETFSVYVLRNLFLQLFSNGSHLPSKTWTESKSKFALNFESSSFSCRLKVQTSSSLKHKVFELSRVYSSDCLGSSLSHWNQQDEWMSALSRQAINEWIQKVVASSSNGLQRFSAMSFFFAGMYDFKAKFSRDLFECYMADCSLRRNMIFFSSKKLFQDANISNLLISVIEKTLFKYWKEILLIPKTLTVMEKELVQAWLYLLLLKARYLTVICHKEKNLEQQRQLKKEILENMNVLPLRSAEFQYYLNGILAILNEGEYSEAATKELISIQLRKSRLNSLILKDDKLPSHLIDEMNTPALLRSLSIQNFLMKLIKNEFMDDLTKHLDINVIDYSISFPWIIVNDGKSRFWINILNAFIIRDGTEIRNSMDAFMASKMYDHVKLLSLKAVTEINYFSWNIETAHGSMITVSSGYSANFAWKMINSRKFFILQSNHQMLPFRPHKSFEPYLTWVSDEKIRFETKDEVLIAEILIQKNRVSLEEEEWKLMSLDKMAADSQLVKFEKVERMTLLEDDSGNQKLFFNHLTDYESKLPLVFNLNRGNDVFRLSIRSNLFLCSDQNLPFISNHDFLVLCEGQSKKSFIIPFRLNIDKEALQSLMIAIGQDFLSPQHIENSRLFYQSVPSLKSRISKMIYSLALMKQKMFSEAFNIMRGLDHFQPFSNTEEELLALMIKDFYVTYSHSTPENAALRFLLLAQIWKNQYTNSNIIKLSDNCLYSNLFDKKGDQESRSSIKILNNYYSLSSRIPVDLHVHSSSNSRSFLQREDEIFLLKSLADCYDLNVNSRLKVLVLGEQNLDINYRSSSTKKVEYTVSPFLEATLAVNYNDNIDEIALDLPIGIIEKEIEKHLTALLVCLIDLDEKSIMKIQNLIEKIDHPSASSKLQNICAFLKAGLNPQTRGFVQNEVIGANIPQQSSARRNFENELNQKYRRDVMPVILNEQNTSFLFKTNNPVQSCDFNLPDEIPEKLLYRPADELLTLHNYLGLFKITEVMEDFANIELDIKDNSEYAKRKLDILLKQISSKKASSKTFSIGSMYEMKFELGAKLSDFLMKRENIVKEIYEIIVPKSLDDHGNAFIFGSIMSGKQSAPSIQELIQLFGRRDANFYARKFPFLKDIGYFHSKIGDLCCTLIQIQQLGRVLDLIEKIDHLENSSETFVEKQQELLNDLYGEISYSRPYNISEMPFLFVFETMENITIRTSHVQDLKKLLSMNDGSFNDFILQRSMASGKTFLVDPILAHEKCNGKSLHVLMLPESLFVNNSRDICARIGNLFNQECLIFNFPRMGNENFEEKIAYLRIKLQRAIQSKSTVVAFPSQIQLFQNTFLKTFLGGNFKDDSLSSAIKLEEELEKIFALLRLRAERTQDEMEMSNNPFAEFNFALEDKIHLNEDACHLITQIFYHLVTNNEIAEKLKLRENLQVYFDQSLHMKWLRSELFKNVVWPWIEKSVSSSEKDLVFELMTNDEEEKSGSKISLVKKWFSGFMQSDSKDLGEALAILRSFMIDWLPKLLNQSVDHNFGFSVKEREEKPFAIPYSAGNTPKEGSEFAGVWEVLLKTITTYLVKGISIPQADQHLRKLRLKAIDEITNAAKKKINLSENSIFSTAKLLLKRSIIELDPGSKEDLEYFQSCFNSHKPIATDFTFSFLRTEIIPKISSKKLQITNYPLFLSLIFKSDQGFSGTIENTFMFPSRILATNSFELDDSSNGNVMRSILSRRGYRLGIVERNNSTIDQIISGILKKGMGKEHAIIDLGAQFKGFFNRDVAFSICKYYQDRGNERKVSLFFDDETGKLSFWKCKSFSAGYKALSSSSRDSILAETESKSLEDIFAYYGNLHIVGADIPHVPDALAFVMLGMDIKFSDLLQAVMRMRKLLTSQQLLFITTPELEKALYGNGTVDSYISLAIRNSIEMERQQNFLLFRQKCLVEIADSIFNEIPKLHSKKQKSILLKSFDWVFIRDLTEHFVKDFLAESFMSTAEKVLHKQIDFFEKKISISVTKFVQETGISFDLHNLSSKFKEILGSFPMLDETLASTSCPLDAPTGGIVEQQQEQEQEQENEIQMEQQQEQQSIAESLFHGISRGYNDFELNISKVPTRDFSHFDINDMIVGPDGLFSHQLIMSDAGCLSHGKIRLTYGSAESLKTRPLPITSYILRFHEGNPYLVMGNSLDTRAIAHLISFQSNAMELYNNMLIVDPYSSVFLRLSDASLNAKSLAPTAVPLWAIQHSAAIKQLLFQSLWYTGNCAILSDPFWDSSLKEFLSGDLKLARLIFFSLNHLQKCDSEAKLIFAALEK